MNSGDDLYLTWRFIDFAHTKPAKHCLVELRIGTACEEGVELVEDRKVGVFRRGTASVAAAQMMDVEVDLISVSFKSINRS